MKLFILFGQRKQRYDGEYAPEALLCWDEFSVDANPEGFAAEIAGTKEKYNEDFSAIRMFHIEINGNQIAESLNAISTIKGKITEET